MRYAGDGGGDFSACNVIYNASVLRLAGNGESLQAYRVNIENGVANKVKAKEMSGTVGASIQAHLYINRR